MITCDFQVKRSEIFSQLSVKDLLLYYECPQEEKMNIQPFLVKNITAPSNEIVIGINANTAVRTFYYSIIPYFRQKPAPAEDLLALKFKESVFGIFASHFSRVLEKSLDYRCCNTGSRFIQHL